MIFFTGIGVRPDVAMQAAMTIRYLFKPVVTLVLGRHRHRADPAPGAAKRPLGAWRWALLAALLLFSTGPASRQLRQEFS